MMEKTQLEILGRPSRFLLFSFLPDLTYLEGEGWEEKQFRLLVTIMFSLESLILDTRHAAYSSPLFKHMCLMVIIESLRRPTVIFLQMFRPLFNTPFTLEIQRLNPFIKH